MSSYETRGNLADQADASILAAERAAIEAVRAERARRLAERDSDGRGSPAASTEPTGGETPGDPAERPS